MTNFNPTLSPPDPHGEIDYTSRCSVCSELFDDEMDTGVCEECTAMTVNELLANERVYAPEPLSDHALAKLAFGTLLAFITAAMLWAPWIVEAR